MVLLTYTEVYYLLSNADLSLLYILHNTNIGVRTDSGVSGYIKSMNELFIKICWLNKKQGLGFILEVHWL